MLLRDLLEGLEHDEIRGDDDITVRSICYHSHEVEQGSLFVAIPGFKTDGREYITQAVRQGASAVVFEGPFFDNLRVTQVRVSGARLALARLSTSFFAHPTASMYLAGVTGTNGKTTLTYLMESLWQAAGLKTGIIGTINIRYGKTVTKGGQTTPESRDLQKNLLLMLQEGVEHACMEVSSHAVSLHRIDECQFDSCVFTNLTQDHLDFHESMESYYGAKEELFTDHLKKSSKRNKLAIICLQDPFSKRLVRRLKGLKMSFATCGLKPPCDLYPLEARYGFSGIKARLKRGRGSFSIEAPLLGRFNLLNILASIQLGFHSGLTVDGIQRGLKDFKGVPGRMEKINDSRGRHIFVDYAHTPDALKNVLEMLRGLTSKRVIVVFGCGGDRDKTKRPLMGRVASELADVALVTSDNPRTEDPQKIIDDILSGIKGVLGPLKKGGGYLVEMDRRRAIQKALEEAERGEVVLIAGKGHEDYQILGQTKHPFSDQQVVREAFSNPS